MATKLKFPKCPSWGRKGLHYAPHRHVLWAGWYDYEHLRCRFCHNVFNRERVYQMIKLETNASYDNPDPLSLIGFDKDSDAYYALSKELYTWMEQ